MSWKSGSRLFGELIEILVKNVEDDESRRDIYVDMISTFEDMDWDGHADCLGADHVYDELYEEMYGEEPEELDFEGDEE